MKDRKLNSLIRANSSFSTYNLKDRIDCYEKSGKDTDLENNALEIKNKM